MEQKKFLKSKVRNLLTEAEYNYIFIELQKGAEGNQLDCAIYEPKIETVAQQFNNITV